jgi:N-acetylneuraminic acid mutarotase
MLLCCLLTTSSVFAQNPVEYYVELQPMPERVANNAVTAALVDDMPYVYSFMGIDSTKIWSGIHPRAYRFNVLENTWKAIAPVPDPAGGRIAAAASTVKNKVYLIGGYRVAQNGTESTSGKVHRFDPENNSWLTDGADAPVPIDDHVQAVWRDSLIFVVTGWNTNTTVANVQVYNPTTDVWSAGTPVPNTSEYKVFGASGYIHGDTLYYMGGARNGSNFPATTVLRKGYIPPDNPTQVVWSAISTPIARGYRMAAGTMAGEIVWIGGSDITYNFDGIAYNGSGGVPALARAKTYSDSYGLQERNDPGLFPAIMDLRGVGQIMPDYLITAGGMAPDQEVTNKVYGFQWQIALSAGKLETPRIAVWPNPTDSWLNIDVADGIRATLFDLQGKPVLQSNTMRLNVEGLPNGMYVLHLMTVDQVIHLSKVVVAR